MNKAMVAGAVVAGLLGCYYFVKPWIPRRLRYGLRRRLIARIRHRHADTWPIKHGTQTPPAHWPGWPEGKRFAFVLTHDVEGREGLERCRDLMELEERHGFRASYHFVPEGEYRLPTELRGEMKRRGFEVAVHDLQHDGKLFSSRERFRRSAEQINGYVKQWGAVGFRAGFMRHNLDWQRDLEVLYDASTFDVDPFEPQPDGVGTIFPFRNGANEDGGFIELPYTLVQDSTLFLMLGEKSIDIWKRKLDWIAKHGGMALLITHPDYMDFSSGAHTWNRYPSRYYSELLDYVKTQYEGQYWHALASEVANYWNALETQSRPAETGPTDVAQPPIGAPG